MAASVLYCGDTELSGAACYLAGLLTHFGREFDYLRSDQRLTAELAQQPRQLFIFSDFPSQQVTPEAFPSILRAVEHGAGLLMIGGWESFHGLGGDWDRTPLAATLPVRIATHDDRVNSWRPAMLVPTTEHPILAGLPWHEEPAFVGGWNAIHPAAGAQPLLALHTFEHFRLDPRGNLAAQPGPSSTGLVIGHWHQGRTACFASDIAPHWVGGFVDWGLPRITAQAPGGPSIEVGAWYAQFWRQLLDWLIGDRAGTGG